MPNGLRPAPCALYGVPAGGRDETTPICRNWLERCVLLFSAASPTSLSPLIVWGSGAPMMMASDHFIREDEDLRPENALLGNRYGMQNLIAVKRNHPILIKFANGLFRYIFWNKIKIPSNISPKAGKAIYELVIEKPFSKTDMRCLSGL